MLSESRTIRSLPGVRSGCGVNVEDHTNQRQTAIFPVRIDIWPSYWMLAASFQNRSNVMLASHKHLLLTRNLMTLVAALAATSMVEVALGHGVPIDVIAVDGKLTPFLKKDLPAEIASLRANPEDFIIQANSPGFGITNQANAIAPGTSLGLNVVSMLGYWDGSELQKPDASLRIESPVGSKYVVHASSGDLTGMKLGKYQGFPFWEADNLYTLMPTDSAFGLYGFMAQITSPDYVDSEPFLFPLVYDPGITLGPTGFQNGVAALRKLFGTKSYDVNQDGTLDGLDINSICSNVGTNDAQFDFDGDGQVSVSDAEAWLAANFTGVGDANLDGAVNFADFLLLSANFRTANGSAVWTQGDFNCDADVNFADFLSLSSNFGSTEQALHIGSLQAVPEPTSKSWTLLLLLLSLRFFPSPLRLCTH